MHVTLSYSEVQPVGHRFEVLLYYHIVKSSLLVIDLRCSCIII